MLSPFNSIAFKTVLKGADSVPLPVVSSPASSSTKTAIGCGKMLLSDDFFLA